MTIEENAPERSHRRRITRAQVARFIQAVRDSDQATVNEMVLRLSRVRPWLAPLAFAVGAFAMLFDGVKLLFTNWRLTLIQVLPAMWIWAAMLDLKAHVLHDKAFHVLIGPAIVFSHSAGGPMGWLIADARPELVKATVAIEPLGPPFIENAPGGFSLPWGVTASPMTFDPPAHDAAELMRVVHEPPAPGAPPVVLQADPPRRLVNLARVPIALVEDYTQPLPKPAGAVVDEIKALVAQLNADDWSSRQKAQEQLSAMGSMTTSVLRDLRPTQPEEAQSRIDQILAGMEQQQQKKK